MTTPEFQYDDYAGVDAKGKIVAVLEFEAPASLPATERADYMDGQVKSEVARDQGAIGLIEIQTPDLVTGEVAFRLEAVRGSIRE